MDNWRVCVLWLMFIGNVSVGVETQMGCREMKIRNEETVST